MRNLFGSDLSIEDNGQKLMSKKTQNSSIVQKVMLTLGAVGFLTTPDIHAQNSQKPSDSIAPASTNEYKNTTTEVGNSEIITLLQKNRNILIQKYPSLQDDATWGKVVGSISAKTIQKTTLDYLAMAFVPNGDEYKQLIAFGNSLENQKQNTILETTDASTTIKKPLPGSKEEKEMKRLQKVLETATANLNKSLMDQKSWTVATDKTDSAKLKKGPGGQGFIVEFVDKRSDKPVRSGGVHARGQLPAGQYDVEIQAKPEGCLRVYLYDADGNEVSQDGAPAEAGKAKINLNNGTNTISIPQNCVSIGFHGLVSPVNRTLEVSKIAFTASSNTFVVR